MESSLVVESPATAPAQRIPVLTPKTIFIIHPSDLLTDHKPNGDGLVACDFIKGLAKRGHRLLVAARNTDLAQSLPSNVIIYHLPTKIKIPMLDRLEYMWRVRRLFKRLAQQEQIDLAHQMNPVFSGLSLALAGIKIPLVLGAYVPRWPNDPDAVAGSSPWAKEFFQSLNRFVCSVQQRCATVLMLTSPAALNRIPFPEQVQSKIFPIAIGIDTDIFSPLTQTPRASKPTILFLANLQKKKGIFVLLDAFADVFKAVPNCRLIVAGAGPEAEAISQKLQAMDCKHNVELVGRIERPDVPALLHRADVFCLPSFRRALWRSDPRGYEFWKGHCGDRRWGHSSSRPDEWQNLGATPKCSRVGSRSNPRSFGRTPSPLYGNGQQSSCRRAFKLAFGH